MTKDVKFSSNFHVFFLHGMPAGQAVSRFGSGIFFFSSS